MWHCEKAYVKGVGCSDQYVIHGGSSMAAKLLTKHLHFSILLAWQNQANFSKGSYSYKTSDQEPVER